jgi:CheY-like chemotaxis protein
MPPRVDLNEWTSVATIPAIVSQSQFDLAQAKLALTAYAHSEDTRRALKAGFQTRVAKPVEPIDLATAPPSLAGRGGSEESHEESAEAMRRGHD